MANTRYPRYLQYVSEVMCCNCRLKTRIRIPIGKKIEEMTCPKCGLSGLHHPSYFERPSLAQPK